MSRYFAAISCCLEVSGREFVACLFLVILSMPKNEGLTKMDGSNYAATTTSQVNGMWVVMERIDDDEFSVLSKMLFLPAREMGNQN